uniref:Oleosin S1-2 n=1 Tax=Elaeis guineensis var. tenera TaxID=51953 RepID=A0A6I9QN29_ELAGV|nr:oleosin S1-2 [Elaeis guineensis]
MLPLSTKRPICDNKPPQANITNLKHQQIKMAEQQHIPGSAKRISSTTILYATLSGLAIGGLLLGMMGFTLIASLTLLLVASPLLLLFSPIILPAAFVVAASMAGFSFAAAMAVVGVSALNNVRRGPPVAISRMIETKTESRQRVKEEWVDHGGCMHHTVEVLPSENENVVNRE